jgi:hypothetical protein
MLCDSLGGVAGALAETLRSAPAAIATVCRLALTGPRVIRTAATPD